MECAKFATKHQGSMPTIFIHVQLCVLDGIFIMGFVYVLDVMYSLPSSQHIRLQQNLLNGLSRAVVRDGTMH